MARPYRDGVELIVDPVDRAVYSLSPDGSVIIRGLAHPGVDVALPIILSPGYEYRIRTFVDESRDDPLWKIERRTVGSVDED